MRHHETISAVEQQQSGLVECMRDTEALHHDVTECVRVTEQSAHVATALTTSLQDLVTQQQAVVSQHKRELQQLDEQSKANALINQNLEREISTHKRRRLQSPAAAAEIATNTSTEVCLFSLVFHDLN